MMLVRSLCYCSIVMTLLPLSGIGQEVAPLEGVSLLDLEGQAVDLQVPEGGALALVFLWSECPISNQFSPTLIRIAEEFQEQPARIVGVFVDADKSDAEVAAHAGEYGLNFPIARKGGVPLAMRLDVGIVPSAVVIDDQGHVRYQGRISDLFFDLGKRRQAPQSQELQKALKAILAGEEVAEPRVEAIGCTLPDFRDDNDNE
ncbi:hypothetical protein BH23PLA1_BH23PLA1_40970 [soil metagenome]